MKKTDRRSSIGKGNRRSRRTSIEHRSPTLLASIPSSVIKDEHYPQHIYVSSEGSRVAIGNDFGVILRTMPTSAHDAPLSEVFCGSHQPIVVSAVSPDARRIAGGDVEGNLYVWEKDAEGVGLQVFRPDMKHVALKDLCISADGRLIAVVGIDRFAKKTAAILNIRSGANVGILKTHERGTCSVSLRPVAPIIAVTGGNDGRIFANSGLPFRHGIELSHRHDGKCFCVRWNHKGDHLATLSESGQLFIFHYDGQSFQSQTIVDGQDLSSSSSVFYSLSWRHDDQYLAIASDNKILIFSIESCQLIDSLRVKSSPRGIVWSAKDILVVSDVSGHEHGYPFRKGSSHLILSPKPKFTWTGPIGTPTCHSRDGSTVIFGTNLGALLFLKYSTAKMESYSYMIPAKQTHTVRFIVARDGIVMCGLSGGGVHLLSFDWHGSLISNQEESDSTVHSEGHPDDANKGAISREMVIASLAQYDLYHPIVSGVPFNEHRGVLIIARKDDRHSQVFSMSFGLPEGSKFKPSPGISLPGRAEAISANRNGRYVAIAMEISHAPAGSRRSQIGCVIPDNTHEIEIYGCQVSNDADRINCQLECVRRFTHHSKRLVSIALSDDASWFASSDKSNLSIFLTGLDATIRTTTFQEWKPELSNHLNLHDVPISCLNWNDNNRTLLTGASDGNYHLICPSNDGNETSGWYSTCQKAHQGGISSLCFLHSNIIVSSGNDAAMKIWELLPPNATMTEDLF